MAQGKKYNDDIKEKAFALLATNNSVAEVAKILELPRTTVQSWKDSMNKDEEFVALRRKKKSEFVEDAWKIINSAKSLLQRRLDRAIQHEDALDELVDEINRLDYKDLTNEQRKALYKKLNTIKVEDVGKIATVLGTIYDKQALANDEPTEKITISLEEMLKKAEGKSDY